MKKACTKFLLVLTLLLLTLCALGGCGTEPTVTPAEPDQTENSKPDTGNKNESGQTTVHVGEVLTTDKLKITYTDCGDYTDYNQFTAPKEGFKFIKLTLSAENIGDADANISNFYFSCYADGVAMDANYFGDDNLSATISPGRKANGNIYFEVPTDAESIEVEYESDFWTSKKAIFIVK